MGRRKKVKCCHRHPRSRACCLRHVLQRLIWLGMVAVVVVPTAYVFLSHQADVEASKSRISCLPATASESDCWAAGCLWYPIEGGAPSCYFPPLHSHGYLVQDQNVSSGIWTATLVLLNSSAQVVPDLKKKLLVQLTQHGDAYFRLKVTVPGEERYEPPVPLQLPASQPPLQQLYNVSFCDENDKLFALVVRRRDTGTAIFDSRVGGFTFASQFVQVATVLPSHDLYGLGEHSRVSFRHSFDQPTVYPLFASSHVPSPGATTNLYGFHPVYYVIEDDNHAHAVLWLSSNAMEVELIPSPGLALRSIGGVLDLYFMLGSSPSSVIQQYTQLVGLPAMPPYWALGFQLSRYGYYNTSDIQDVVARTRRCGIPQDVQYADIETMEGFKGFTLDTVQFGDLPQYVLQLREEGVKFVTILDPHIPVFEGPAYPVHERAMDQDVYIKWGPDADLPDGGDNFGLGDVMLLRVGVSCTLLPELGRTVNSTAVPDFLRSSTSAWWTNEISIFSNDSLSFDGLWIDMNEPEGLQTNYPDDPRNLQCYSNSWDDPPYPTLAGANRLSDRTLCMSAVQGQTGQYRHYDVHNLYGWAQARATAAALESLHGRRGIVISRSTFPSSGQWVGHWLGDNKSSWGHLIPSIIGMLEFNMFGVPYVGSDICGYFGDASEELCGRWMQLGAFYPFSRNHNRKTQARQDPGMWPSVAAAGRVALRQRYLLLPYLYTLHYRAAVLGEPVVRSLAFEFPGDHNARTVSTQFLWGPFLMICPALEEGVEEVRVYFPAGSRWYSIDDGVVWTNVARYRDVPAPLGGKVPVFVRGGAILPTQRPAANTVLSRKNPLGLIVAPSVAGMASGDFFWDDGEGLGEQGRTCINENNRLGEKRTGWVPCSLPPPSVLGYTVAGPAVTTSTGYRLPLFKQGLSVFGSSLVNVTFEVAQLDDHLLRVKLYDSTTTRFEVPLPLNYSTSSAAKSPLYEVQLASENVGDFFSFSVVRKKTKTVLFDTRLGGLVLEDQFLSITSLLPSKNVYGLGENTHASFRADMDGTLWGLFTRDQWPEVDMKVNLYGVHPYYQCIENDGNAHGVLLLNSNAMDYQFLDYPSLTYRTIGGVLDFYFMLGPEPETVTAQYTSLIGRPVMPPYWALGFQLSRYGYENVQHMRDAMNRTVSQGIPIDVQYADIDHMDKQKDFTIDAENFGDLPQYVSELHASGQRFIIILDPAINAELPAEKYPTHSRALEADVYVKWPADTNQSVVEQNNGGDSLIMLAYVWPENRTAFPNWHKQATHDWWAEEIRIFYKELPFDGLWIDMNEPAAFSTNLEKPWNWPEGADPWNLFCPDSKWDTPPYVTTAGNIGPSYKMSDKTLCLAAEEESYLHYDTHNLYGWAQASPTLSALRAVTGERGIVISRSTFVGSGHYAGHWLGDNQSIWPDLHRSIIGMLEFNLFGIPYIGADICGFSGNATEELCGRWMQLGAFYPFSRNHNGKGEVDQDPGVWENTVGVWSRSVLLERYRLLPYLYTLFYKAFSQGYSVVRSLASEFPMDRTCLGIDNQFLWGASFMISPVLEEGVTSRLVYFPLTAWYDYYTGRPVEWPGEMNTVDAPLSSIPLHVRGGAILPIQKPSSTTTQSVSNPMGLLVALDWNRTAEGELFWDDLIGATTISTNQYSLVSFQFYQSTLTMSVTRNNAEDLGSLHLRDIIVYGVEQQPSGISVSAASSYNTTMAYDHTNMKLTLSLDPTHSMNRNIKIIFTGMWLFQ
ncbi:P-type trefoil domain [Trinorchestia longiramus]|nr:P-type trefoil domain [Trinorchestia longiramus]